MNIALLNERIVIQKNEVTVDENRNHTNTWEDYYSCHATISGSSEVAEKQAAGLAVE